MALYSDHPVLVVMTELDKQIIAAFDLCYDSLQPAFFNKAFELLPDAASLRIKTPALKNSPIFCPSLHAAPYSHHNRKPLSPRPKTTECLASSIP